jgi:hypothetical protein
MPFPQTQVVPIQFSGGLNSKIASFTLDQPYLDACENGRYMLEGQIDKRPGFNLLSTNIQGGGNISAGSALTTFNGELLLLDGTNIYSYQSTDQTWIDKGNVFSTVNSQVRVLNSKVSTQSNPDVTTANGISLYVWEDNRSYPPKSNGVRYSVYNNATGTIVLSDQQLYVAGSRPKVVTDGATFFVYYAASSQALLGATVPVGAPSTVTSNLADIVSDGQPSSGGQTIPYDVCLYNGAPLMAYASQSGLRLGAPIGAPASGFPSQVIVNTTTITVIAIAIDSLDRVWLSWCNGTDTFLCVLEKVGGSWAFVAEPFVPNVITPTIAVNIALHADMQPGTMNATFEIAQAGSANVNNNFCNNYLCSTAQGSGGFAVGVPSLIGQMRGVGLASKPFRYGDDLFVHTIAQSNLQSTYFTRCLTKGLSYVPGTVNIQAANDTELATNFALVSSHAPQNGGTYRTNSLLSQADPVSDGIFLFAGQRKGPFTTWQNAASVNLGCAGYLVEFGASNAFNSVQSNNNLHIVGGVKKIYDGVSCVEDNFVLYPENYLGNGCTVSLASGGSLSWSSSNPPQYEWLVVYEWTDNYGQVQRSSPSVAVAATTTADGQAGVLVGPTLRITEKVQARSSVIVSIYRTQANLPIFYKVTSDADPLVNDPTVDSWTFTDTLSDAQIAANENLYTGSQLPNIVPPPCSLISLYQQRLMINSTEDPDVLWYSQNKFEQDQYNTLALDFNTSFVEGVDSRYGNAITAIGLLDNNLAIFKATSVFLLQGDGPNALDTSGQFNDAALLVSDTGCTDQNSLVFVTQTPNSPGGLLFKSPKGIYLLGRDQSLTYVGAPVEAYNDLTISSASLLSQTNEIVFTTEEGTALVYNYFFNAWSTWTNLPAVDACVWQGQLCLLGAAGDVMVQDATGTVFSDAHADGVTYPVSLLIRTPFLKLSGMQGYQSIFGCYLLGKLQAPHVLQVSVAYDYNPSAQGSVLVNSTIAGAGRWGGLPIWGSTGAWGNNGLFNNYQFQINVNTPRCQSIQFTFQDVQPEPSQGFSLNGLALEVLAIPGPMRLPKQNKVALS